MNKPGEKGGQKPFWSLDKIENIQKESTLLVNNGEILIPNISMIGFKQYLSFSHGSILIVFEDVITKEEFEESFILFNEGNDAATKFELS